jgi:ribosomal protein S18 acetylase RimI-like enzyme
MKLYVPVEIQGKITSLTCWSLRHDLHKMSAMEVAALPDASADHLTTLFREEASHWKKQLYWDYDPTLRLVKKLVASSTLPGFVLMHGREAIGYSYFVFDRPVGFIGGLYVLDSFAEQANYHQLILKLVTTMRSLKYMERIESQVMPFNAEFASNFVELGFKALPRHFLSAAVSSEKVLKKVRALEKGNDFKVQSWRPDFMVSAAEVIYDSYVESPDVDLCRDYQSRKGCTRFLKNLIESPTCGKFSQKDTRVALDQNGRICGILLATKIDSDTGMIPQLSVRRDRQGKGVGSSLLAEYMKAAAGEGLERVSLSVSQANKRAFDLYKRLGFETEKRFHALIWER